MAAAHANRSGLASKLESGWTLARAGAVDRLLGVRAMKLIRCVLVVLCVAAVGVVPAVPAEAGGASGAQPPVVTKDFQPSSLPLGGIGLVVIEIENTQNAITTLTGVTVSDTLPPGVVVITPESGTFCGGTYAALGTTISLTNMTLQPDIACAFPFEIQATTLGPKVNTTSAPTSNEGGTGSPATATLTVGSPPTFAKAFGTSPITVGSTTTLTFTLTNPNAAPLTGAGFTDPLEAGLVASPNGLANTCGGTATAGSGSIALSGGTIPASSSCTLTVNVTGTTTGTKVNTTSQLATSEGLTGSAATASLVVLPVQPPTLTKAFSPSTVAVGATTTLNFTLTNPNPSLAVGLATFSDFMPSGLQLVNGSATSNCDGTLSVTPSVLVLANATLPAGGTCTIQAPVTATSSGVKNNVTSSVTSSTGTGSAATATVTVTSATVPGPGDGSDRLADLLSRLRRAVREFIRGALIGR
jgi:uncharacterized repeat protein (TIGR01451 family)